jgi:copper chaperone CopZ
MSLDFPGDKFLFPFSTMQTTVSIPGIHCAACATLIKDVSSEFPQIQNVEVNEETKKVSLEHSEDFDLSKWIEEVQLLGDTYTVHPIS